MLLKIWGGGGVLNAALFQPQSPQLPKLALGV